jgi:hypothetical protein|nr:MAG TPA: hypothetical protein [Caudoviricetes sp.]DAZ00513.1 MAG TPA: hypothetical protein [Caudoviricetes sp.]
MNTTYFLNQVMGNLFKTKETPALPSEYYIGLSSTAPNISGGNVTEPLSNSGYKRVKLENLSEPADGVITNEQAISFDESTANWGTMSHFVIYDALEAGNLLMYDTLSTPRNVEAATIVTIKANSLTLTLSNPA